MPSSSVSICRWQGDGRTEYRGFGKGNGLAVTAPVVWSNGASYSAVNNGYTYREDTTENRVMFIFTGKPDAETRQLSVERSFSRRFNSSTLGGFTKTANVS